MNKNISTGFLSVDKALGGGLRSGELTLLAARPGMGLTAFAVEIALRNAEVGKRIHIISMLLTSEELSKRIIARDAKVNMFKLREKHRLTEDDIERLDKSSRKSFCSGIFIYDRIPDEESLGMYMSAKGVSKADVDLIIVEDLQEEVARHGIDDKETAYTVCLNQLTSLAKKFDVPVVCCSKVPRACEKREDKRPTLNDMKFLSKSAVKEPINVIFLYRDSYYRDGALEDECEVIVAKSNAFCSYKAVNLKWNGEFTMFSDIIKYFENDT